MERKPDILLMMSDQHAAAYMGCDGGMVDTPNLDKLAKDGTIFKQHYTACPLCVPARMSFLSGQLPTNAGVTANNHTLAEVTPTFLFPLVEAGYETVLIGRMHFVGKDLRHGFIRRIGGDITPTTWIPPRERIMEERGELMPTFSAGGCLNVVGGGENPVRYYDEDIVGKALEYLSEPHEKPQCIVVGTFGPHFPYVADPDLYLKYKERAWLPDSFGETPDFVAENPWLVGHQKQVSRELAIRANAAYCAMVEETDCHVGRVYAAFSEYAKKAGHPMIFGYLSDHGDTVGARNMYGKQTFFEDSARVPFVICGDGIPKGRQIHANTSLVDVGSTICELAGTSYRGRFVDGSSLCNMLKQKDADEEERVVLSQYIESKGGLSIWEAKKPGNRPEPEQFCYAVMARWGKWKYIVYHGLESQAILFDMEKDPQETKNVAAQYPQVVRRLHEAAMREADPLEAEETHRNRNQMNRWLRKYERVTGCGAEERWRENPPTARGQLTVQ